MCIHRMSLKKLNQWENQNETFSGFSHDSQFFRLRVESTDDWFPFCSWALNNSSLQRGIRVWLQKESWGSCCLDNAIWGAVTHHFGVIYTPADHHLDAVWVGGKKRGWVNLFCCLDKVFPCLPVCDKAGLVI